MPDSVAWDPAIEERKPLDGPLVVAVPIRIVTPMRPATLGVFVVAVTHDRRGRMLDVVTVGPCPEQQAELLASEIEPRVEGHILDEAPRRPRRAAGHVPAVHAEDRRGRCLARRPRATGRRFEGGCRSATKHRGRRACSPASGGDRGPRRQRWRRKGQQPLGKSLLDVIGLFHAMALNGLPDESLRTGRASRGGRPARGRHVAQLQRPIPAAVFANPDPSGKPQPSVPESGSEFPESTPTLNSPSAWGRG